MGLARICSITGSGRGRCRRCSRGRPVHRHAAQARGRQLRGKRSTRLRGRERLPDDDDRNPITHLIESNQSALARRRVLHTRIPPRQARADKQGSRTPSGRADRRCDAHLNRPGERPAPTSRFRTVMGNRSCRTNPRSTPPWLLSEHHHDAAGPRTQISLWMSWQVASPRNAHSSTATRVTWRCAYRSAPASAPRSWPRSGRLPARWRDHSRGCTPSGRAPVRDLAR
jgi:hypothetical protein